MTTNANGFLKLLKGFGVSLALLGSFNAHSDQYFENLRVDAYVPTYCRDFSLESFSNVKEWFIYGIDGYTDRGFDYEYPLSRDNATWLWEAFKNGREPQQWPRKLTREVEIIKEFKGPMGFEFGSEGEVLELLSLVDLEKRFSRRDYFMTGGVMYHEGPGQRTIGELDIMVGDMKTCEIVAVGEAKLGTSGLSKAKQQLARFKVFLGSHFRLMRNFFSLPQNL